MSDLERIVADRAPRASGAYSQAIRAGDFVFVSGQGPLDPETGDARGVNHLECG